MHYNLGDWVIGYAVYSNGKISNSFDEYLVHFLLDMDS